MTDSHGESPSRPASSESGGYEDQLARVRRFLQRIDPPTADYGLRLDYEDYLWSFFMNAWHLKDWINEDDAVEVLDDQGQAMKPKRIESIALNHSCIKICADLANRSKHFRLKNTKVDAKLKRKSLILMFGHRSPRGTVATRYGYLISDNSGNEWSAIEQAHEIVKTWEQIVDKHVRKIS